MNDKVKKTRWHRLLGRMLEELLTSVDIAVTTELEIMSQPPKVDLLLLRKNTSQWTKEQMGLLPDGIRDCNANHVLIEFKYTESVNYDVLTQTLSYDTFYRRSTKLSKNKIRTFILSSKTPVNRFLEDFGYAMKEKPGVFYSNNPLLIGIPILSLNDLADAPHNRFVKCFASRKTIKKQALKSIFDSGFSLLEMPLQWFFSGLWKNWFDNNGEDIMEKELTPEKVIEIGKLWGNAYLNSLPPEERLAGLSIKEVLAALKAQVIVGELTEDDIDYFFKYLKK